MKRFQISLFLIFLPLLFFAQQQVSIIVQGHADDWPLFMSQNIAEDITFSKIVIITLTAGDAGHGALAYDKGKIPYYLAREQGCVYASKFVCDMTENEPDNIPTSTMVNMNGHLIAKYNYKDQIVNYFLRLPDGFHAGDGNPATGNQSLLKLKEGKLSSITAVENSTTYQGWNDLVQTIRGIILSEKGTDEQVWMNVQSNDRKYNSGDHSDHYYSSQAAQEAVNDLPWVGIVSWMCYRSGDLPANLSTSEILNASAIFAAYNWGLVEGGYISCFEKKHTRYLPNDYFLITREPTGSSLTYKITDMLQSVKRKLGL